MKRVVVINPLLPVVNRASIQFLFAGKFVLFCFFFHWENLLLDKQFSHQGVVPCEICHEDFFCYNEETTLKPVHLFILNTVLRMWY